MSAERALLARLAEGPVSGAMLARETGLTRAAIWKRIEALREAGLEIEAHAGQGYRLLQPPHWLEAAQIRQALPASLQGGITDLDIVWSLDSTNAELLRRSTPARGVTVLLAEMQSGGRGRRGRVWNSPLGANIYLSVARQFAGGLARLGGLSLVAGVAAAEALQAEDFGAVRLKWPNDLVVQADGQLRKLGGVLVEGGGEYAGPARAIIGLGVNACMPSAAAAQIDQPWIDLQALSQRPVSRNGVVAALLRSLLPALDLFDAEGLTPFLSRYAALDALAGRAINIHEDNGVRAGIARGIAEDGALRVDIEGSEKYLHAGDVGVRAQ